MSHLKQFTRRKFLYSGAAVVAGAAFLGVDGLSESYQPHLVRIELPLARLPRAFDGFTIAQLSDFHYEERFSAVPIRKSVEMVNQLAPDLIVLTGDFVTVPVFESQKSLVQAAATAPPCARILQGLRGTKFAILGNHDAVGYPGKIIRALESNDIPVLRNRAVPVERGGDRIWLAGIDDVLKGHPNLPATLAGIPPGETTILLAHEPDFADQAAFAPVDLQLSGHSHGGQVWIPVLGAPWLPPQARKYPRGLYRIRDLTLYTNLGIGTIRAPIRINCPPEVTLITLRCPSSSVSAQRST
ncbi:MAG TPA: metallophosphoesterase [Terriglobales bacterium]